MDIKEIGKAKLKLEKDLSEAMHNILRQSYKEIGIHLSNIHVYCYPTAVFMDTNAEAIFHDLTVAVSTEFKLT